MQTFTIGLSASHKKQLEPLWERYGLDIAQHYAADEVPVSVFDKPTGEKAVLLFIDNSLNLTELDTYRKLANENGVVLVATTHNVVHHERTLCLQGFYTDTAFAVVPQAISTKDEPFAPRNRVEMVPVTPEPEDASPIETQEKQDMTKQQMSLIPSQGDETVELDYDGVVSLLKDAIRILRDQYGVERVQWAKTATLSIDRLTKDSHPI